jgi:hypothetical protein
VTIAEAGVIEGGEAGDAAEERAGLVGEGVQEEVVNGGEEELLARGVRNSEEVGVW